MDLYTQDLAENNPTRLQSPGGLLGALSSPARAVGNAMFSDPMWKQHISNMTSRYAKYDSGMLAKELELLESGRSYHAGGKAYDDLAKEVLKRELDRRRPLEGGLLKIKP